MTARTVSSSSQTRSGTVRSGDDIAAFLEQSRAEAWAQNKNGKILTYVEARKFVDAERVAQAR